MPDASAPDPLTRTLRTWRVEPPRDPGFRTAVQTRIAAAGAVDSWSAYLRGHAVTVTAALALAVVLGAVGGRSQARARTEADRARLANAYVESLDARTMKMP